MYLLYALGSAVFASFVTILAKLGLKNIDSNLATTIRVFFMTIFLSLFLVIFNRSSISQIKTIETKDIALIGFSGVAGAISWLFYFLALKEAGDNTSKVAALDKLSLVFIFVLSLLILKEKFELANFIGIVLISIGAIIIAI